MGKIAQMLQKKLDKKHSELAAKQKLRISAAASKMMWGDHKESRKSLLLILEFLPLFKKMILSFLKYLRK